MQFKYRDFFNTNDDLHIIKEQLSIVDEWASRENALIPNAKDVWEKYNMYKKEPSGTDGSSGSSGSSGTSGTDGSSGSNEQNIKQKIADELKINVETVQKIITICLMNTKEKKNPQIIAKEFNINNTTIIKVLNNALGTEWKRVRDIHFRNDAVKIYNLHKLKKTPEEIVFLVNSEKPKHLKITVEDVNLVLKIVDIAKKQMEAKGEVNAPEIHREIGGKIAPNTINRLIKKLNLGKPRYRHEFTEEQDAFILYCYLQETPNEEIARKFNEKFSTESNKLKIDRSIIRRRLINKLNLKDRGESEISEYVLYLLNNYTEYFSAVDINDDETKKLLTHYTAPEKSTLKRKDYLRKYHSTRNITGQGTAGTQYFDVGASDNIGPSRVIAKRLGGHSPTT